MSTHREILKHTGNYFLATLATKALSFISIPVYTYLLTVEDYGIINVFMSIVGVTTIIFTLNTEVAISRYYYESKNEMNFRRFVGTSIVLSGGIYLLSTLFVLLFAKPLSRSLGLEYMLVISLLPVSLYNIINGIFQQIYTPLLQSKKIAVVSSAQAYLSFGLSIIFIVIIQTQKYYGMVLGTIAAMLIIGYYIVRQISDYCQLCFNKDFVIYILKFSIPYLPYSLSSIIIAQFGKMFIGQQQGFESAGHFCFVSNVATLMMLLIMTVHSAWNPYHFKYMDNNDYKSIDFDYDIIWRVTLLVGIGLSLFGYEIGSILAKPEYLKSLYLLPILNLGYCFYQLSFVYMRNFSYTKQTIWLSITVIISGFVNILLNNILIIYLKDFGVALSFMLSYFVLFVLSWGINYFKLKTYVPSLRNFIRPLMLSLPFFFFSYINIDNINQLTIAIVKCFIYILSIYIIMNKYINRLIAKFYRYEN